MGMTRREFLTLVAAAAGSAALPRMTLGQTAENRRPVTPAQLPDVILGRPTGTSIALSVLCAGETKALVAYGQQPDHLPARTGTQLFKPGHPQELTLEKLTPNTRYYYQLLDGSTAKPLIAGSFFTQRAPGSAFTFGIQGDSHPERPQMHDPELYTRTLRNAATGNPDFYLCMGDDFSVDTLPTLTAETVTERYARQRPFLGLVAQSAPLFLVNGNHEQASLFNFNQSDDRHDVAVWAQTARNRYFPMPAPDGFYTGNTAPVKSIGLLRDYYAWTWGDALFVVLDNYWHSPARVDNPLHEKPGAGKDGHGGNKDRDWWGISLGDAQYQWFKHTLEQSSAKYKFVFAHHVLGTGRGGVDEADLYEWGGKNRRGDSEFGQHRPSWELPIHSLMVKYGVTIFFQGHDHLYARQERDGIIYQEVPLPADPAYLTRNADRYQSGIKLPNSGHLRVTVAPAQMQVDYVRCFLPKDETDQQKTGTVAYSYTIPAKRPGGAA